MQTLFIADLHLSDDTPDLNALFARFLRDKADKTKTAALYILGDLFEAWTGDDDPSRTAAEVAQNIRAFSQHAPVYFIAGNRDFLLGKPYAKKANMQLLPENYLIEINGKMALLTHGDELCTDDVSYLRYRRIIRRPLVRRLLLGLPFKRRLQIAAGIRAKSRARKAVGNVYAISDVTEQGIAAACARYPQISIIIHGHTHRPNIHTHRVANQTITRYVLPDWKDAQGGYLAIDANGVQMFRLPET